MKLLLIKMLTLFCILSLQYNKSDAQGDQQLNEQFLKIMVAFPGKFESIKGGPVGTYDNNKRHWAKWNITGVKYCTIETEENASAPAFIGSIDTNEDQPMEEMKQRYNRWAGKIDALILNGAKVVNYPTNAYTTEDRYDMYTVGKAWRLDNSKNNIAPEYQNFTIRLELLDLDQGGWLLQLKICGQ